MTGLPAAFLQVSGSVKYAPGAQATLSSTIRLPKGNIIFGMWNVSTLDACVKIKLLAGYKRDILELTEVRWAGFDETITKEGHKI